MARAWQTRKENTRNTVRNIAFAATSSNTQRKYKKHGQNIATAATSSSSCLSKHNILLAG
jgi:hypothetical protein